MDNQNQFKEKLLNLVELFDKEMSPAVVKLYWLSLKDYSDEEVHRAFDLAVLNCKFMPKPVEIRELIEGTSSEQAIGEWGKVLKFMSKTGRFGESKLPDHVLDAVNQIGGWEYLCTLTYRDLEFKGKEFSKIYEGKTERGLIGNHQERITND